MASALRAHRLAPDDLSILHTLATLLLSQGDWGNAEPLIKRLIAEGDEGFLEAIWPDILTLFREAVSNDLAAEALRLLDDSGAGARWRPLREALAAISSGNARYLNAVAPEVREPARRIMERLLAGPEKPE